MCNNANEKLSTTHYYSSWLLGVPELILKKLATMCTLPSVGSVRELSVLSSPSSTERQRTVYQILKIWTQNKPYYFHWNNRHFQ